MTITSARLSWRRLAAVLLLSTAGMTAAAGVAAAAPPASADARPAVSATAAAPASSSQCRRLIHAGDPAPGQRDSASYVNTVDDPQSWCNTAVHCAGDPQTGHFGNRAYGRGAVSTAYCPKPGERVVSAFAATPED